MKKAIGLALVVLMTSVVAASAQGAQKVAASAASSQSINCSSTMTIPFLTPLTGGAGFLGTEQAELGEVRRPDAAQAVRSEGQARTRRHAGRAGPRTGAGTRAEVHLRQERRRHSRAVDLR